MLQQPRNHLCAGARRPDGDRGDRCSESGEEQAFFSWGRQGGLRGRHGPVLAGVRQGQLSQKVWWGDGGQGCNGNPSDGHDQREPMLSDTSIKRVRDLVSLSLTFFI